MSVPIPLSLLPQSTLAAVKGKLTVKEKVSEFTARKFRNISAKRGKEIKPRINTYENFIIENDRILVPIYSAKRLLGKLPTADKTMWGEGVGCNVNMPEGCPAFETDDTECKRTVLRDYQTVAVENAVSRLKQTHTTFISLPTGMGKTLTALCVLGYIRQKTAILLDREVLFEQWKVAIENVYTGLKVRIVKGKAYDPGKDKSDIILVSPLTIVNNYTPSDLKDFGVLIVDEAHLLCSPKKYEAMIRFTPKHSIGLSATPTRSDEMCKFLDLNFGPRGTHITEKLSVTHPYYFVNTRLVPDVPETKPGYVYSPLRPVKWSGIIEWQSTNPERNKIILNLCRMFPRRTILVLTKRVVHTMDLFNMLVSTGESVDYLTGTKRDFNTGARILISTYSKSGVGFDHPKLDTLIVAADVLEGFEQYFGRCIRRRDVKPMFIDLVDDFGVLRRHFESRAEYSRKVGGAVKDFCAEFGRTVLDIVEDTIDDTEMDEIYDAESMMGGERE